MFLKKKKLLSIIVFIAILLCGLYLRHINYRTLPRHGATFDEFAWTWLGINIIQNGVPISWSPQPQYKTRTHLIYQGAAFWIVRPYLEHPPLFGLVAGASSMILGAKDMYHVTLMNMRPLALFLGGMSIAMIFLLTRQLYNDKIGLLATAIYATVPTLVIGSRIVQNENFLIPSWLLSLIFLHLYLQKQKKRYFLLSAGIAGLLSLAKAPWLVVGISLAMILSYNKRWKDAFIAIGIVIALFLIYPLYACYFDCNLFIDLMRLQTARYDISFSGFYAIFTNPLLVDRYYVDGWVYFGWMSMLLIAKDVKKHAFILLPFLAYLVIYIFGIPNEPLHGWYRFPFLPFLVVASAFILWEEYQKRTLVSLLFLFIVGLSLMAATWQEAFGFSYLVYRIFILLLASSILIPMWFPKYARISKLLVGLWFLFFVLLNIAAVSLYRE